MPIHIKNLSFSYSEFGINTISAIDNLNLTIQEGEFIGIVGHTGSGKSTFIQHINGLLLATSGEVVVDGMSITKDKKHLKSIRQNIGFVFQYPENQLFEETVYKDIAFGPTNLGLSKSEIDTRVKQALHLVSLDFDTYAHRSPFELSGGEMRRVAIAGVIAMQPKYLILDEPTAGLDPQNRHNILNMLSALHAKRQTTIIMVTHNMDEIIDYSTRVLVFSKGKIVLDNIPQKIFENKLQLNQLQLEQPQYIQLYQQLKQKGLPLDDNLYKKQDIFNNIISVLKENYAK